MARKVTCRGLMSGADLLSNLVHEQVILWEDRVFVVWQIKKEAKVDEQTVVTSLAEDLAPELFISQFYEDDHPIACHIILVIGIVSWVESLIYDDRIECEMEWKSVREDIP